MDKIDISEISRSQKKSAFDSAYSEAIRSDQTGTTPDPTMIYGEFVTPLGTELEKTFHEAEVNRVSIEDVWLKDLRQTKGEYDPEVLGRLHPKRSKAYMNLTQPKIKTVTARMMDLLFPANGHKNWGVSPTPIPELDAQTIMSIEQQLAQQTGKSPGPDEVMKIIKDEAQRRCDNMQQEIADQLAEIKYRKTIKEVISSGNQYGTGILKGPLIKEQIVKRWLPDGKGGWTTVEIPRRTPYCEFVPVWDIYPDMTARSPEQMRYIFQRYAMNRNDVYMLSKRSDFKAGAIKAFLEAYPDGNAEFKNHEESLRGMSEGSESTPSTLRKDGKYEVREFWGYLSAGKMKEIGVDIPEDQLGMEFAANIWLLGPVVIKAVLSPLEGVQFPFHFYFYEKDETSIFGYGIPKVMRDCQTLFNASVRAMLDNAAISAGPIIEANVDLLAHDEDPTDLFPFRVFQRDGTGVEATAQAIRVTSLPSYTGEYLTMVKFFMEMSDEATTVPRYLHGDNNSTMRGAGRTASGLSMLMGAANIGIKDQVKNYDDGVTIPYIKAHYFWNMEFNPKENIKGDFSVSAKGSSSLIAKEVRSEHLNQFLSLTNNEIDMMYVRRDNILREVVKSLDLDDLDLIKSPDQVKGEERARQEKQDEDEKFMKEIAMMKAESGGHMNTPGMGTDQVGI